MPKTNEFLLRSLINQVIAYAEQHYQVSDRESLNKFTRIFYSQSPYEELKQREIRDLAGLVHCNWQLLQTRKPDEIKITMIDSDLKSDGWQTHGLSIAVLCQDAPFLVDTIRLEINKINLPINLIIHVGGMVVERDGQGNLIDFDFFRRYETKQSIEAPILFEVQAFPDEELQISIASRLERVITDALLAVRDWQLMRLRMSDVVKKIETRKEFYQKASDAKESMAFLKWLLDDNFIFLGARDYIVEGEGSDQCLRLVSGSGLGVLSNEDKSQVVRKFTNLPAKAAKLMRSNDRILMISKSNTLSTVHRSGYTDYIGIKQFDQQGNLAGERRFIGLYTSAAYHSSPSQIPFLGKKVDAVLKRSGLREHSHAEKELITILATLPRDDLIQAPVSQLYRISMGILHMQERKQVRLFVREDNYGRFVSCLVYLPREKFTTDLLKKMQGLLMNEFHGIESSFTTRFAVSVLARIDFVIRLDRSKNVRFQVDQIEQKLIGSMKSWNEQLREKLLASSLSIRSSSLLNRYSKVFPTIYRERNSPEQAMQDIALLESLDQDNPITLDLKVLSPAENCSLSFKVFSLNGAIPLSDALPVLENLGCRVVDDYPCQLKVSQNSLVWFNEFHMTCTRSVSQQAIEFFKEYFLRVWMGDAENDPFNNLILLAELSWRQVSLMRAYAKYFRQTGTSFSPYYIAETLTSNPIISKRLVNLFESRFDYSDTFDESLVMQIERDIVSLLDDVKVLDQDRILRKYLSMITSTLRTNYFQKGADGQNHTYISLKFDTASIIDMAKPWPLCEIFVYAVDFEGLHMRTDKVARGGIRWSDRTQDFRFEILDLMKAQQVKNSVIVPSGAKGGFVIKSSTDGLTRDEYYELGVSCYQRFISGLLDVVDNLNEGQVIKHPNTRCYDGNDEYLVVAADKGTARFSDIANEISVNRGFWLGDAFASGGSTGYDHMKMGITARGAWISGLRHFIDLGINIETDTFSVIGIGDMSGDVFGNGLLMSENTQLVCAFNHEHIFLDPSPDTKTSYRERKRLFELPRSKWSDYDSSLISKGGGVFSRSLKTIKTTPQIRKLLSLTEKTIEPSQLIRKILCAPVDMIWNGGIGTFVKSERESHFDASDVANDAIRVNGSEVKAKIICEGGNLGVTQLGRIEYELHGGRINTDFIDNSAGVDCSDHEVNMKILLSTAVNDHTLSFEERNNFLKGLTDDVSDLVLMNNYVQNKSISFASFFQHKGFAIFTNFIDSMVSKGVIDQHACNLPSHAELAERQQIGLGLTRPELSVLLAHSKIHLANELLPLLESSDESFKYYLYSAFPKAMHKRFSSYIDCHPLRQEIIVTQLAHHAITDMGITFVNQIKSELDVSSLDVVRAYVVAHEIFDTHQYQSILKLLDGKIPSEQFYEISLEHFILIRHAVRWLISQQGSIANPDFMVSRYKPIVLQFCKNIENLLDEASLQSFNSQRKKLMECGLNQSQSLNLSVSKYLAQVLNMVEVIYDVDSTIQEVSSTYFTVRSFFNLDLLREAVMDFSIKDKWLIMTKSMFVSQLDFIEQLLTSMVIRGSDIQVDPSERISSWVVRSQFLIEPWMKRLSQYNSQDVVNVPAIGVLVEQLRKIAVREYIRSPGKNNLLEYRSLKETPDNR